MTDDQVFIVRCWNEMPDDSVRNAMWRFRVSHLGSGEERHFADVDGVARFIDACLADTDTPPERKRPI